LIKKVSVGKFLLIGMMAYVMHLVALAAYIKVIAKLLANI